MNLRGFVSYSSECEFRDGNEPANRAKNRYQDILPSDRHRPYLLTTKPDVANNYINAGQFYKIFETFCAYNIKSLRGVLARLCCENRTAARKMYPQLNFLFSSVFVTGYQNKHGFIATQMPLPNTIRFLQLAIIESRVHFCPRRNKFH